MAGVSASWFQRLADGFRNDEEVELRVRIFRLICALTGSLCLFVVAPLNATQHLPLGVHVSNIVLGLMGAFCYWQSCRGRHFIGTYFTLLVLLLDAVWFWNAGSDGSVTHFFYPVMLFVIILFEGWRRWALAGALWINVSILFVVEHFYPNLVTPFQSSTDRLVDTVTGMFCSFTALVGVAWFMLISYRREQRRVAEIAARRRQALETLRLNEERLRLAMEASRQGWFELNVQTGETVSSPEYVALLEYEPDEFRSNLQGWIERIHPADRADVLKGYQGGLTGPGLAAVEYRQKTKSGGWKWIRSVAKVVEFDSAGRPLRVMGTHADISDRKELESQLLHSQRLEAVGTLASGVAHDLNNILTPMLMASGILRHKLTDASDRNLMTMLDEGGRRGAAIVRQLLDFSRSLAQDRVPVDPRRLLRDMAQLMRSSFPKEITVVEATADVPGLVEVELNQMHQVLMNLCVNARDAMAGRGTITLGLDRVEVPAGPNLPGGTYLVLSVGDTGHGIPPEIMAKIFDPFFTTKPTGQGTGLGLASVHGIVKAHRGFVRVESPPGQGATFRVHLPAREGAVAKAPAAAEPEKPAPRSATAPAAILVVDDDEVVRHTTCRFLQRFGYEPIPAPGGPEAIELLRQRLADVDLVITDFSMPGMDGPTLAPHLRALKPGIRLIGVSGLNHDHRQAELAQLGFAEILAKPYELNELMDAVRRQLAAAGT